MIEHHSYMNGKENNLKSMSASRPEGLRRTAKFDQGQIFPRETDNYELLVMGGVILK